MLLNVAKRIKLYQLVAKWSNGYARTRNIRKEAGTPEVQEFIEAEKEKKLPLRSLRWPYMVDIQEDAPELITDHAYVPRADRAWKFCDICSFNRRLHADRDYKLDQYYQYLRSRWDYSDGEAVRRVQELEKYFTVSGGDSRVKNAAI